MLASFVIGLIDGPAEHRLQPFQASKIGIRHGQAQNETAVLNAFYFLCVLAERDAPFAIHKASRPREVGFTEVRQLRSGRHPLLLNATGSAIAARECLADPLDGSDASASSTAGRRATCSEVRRATGTAAKQCRGADRCACLRHSAGTAKWAWCCGGGIGSASGPGSAT